MLVFLWLCCLLADEITYSLQHSHQHAHIAAKASKKLYSLRLSASSSNDQLQERIITSFDQIQLTLRYRLAKQQLRSSPPLLFIHGSFHGSWCWEEHYLPYFASHGYDTYAINLRGTSLSPTPNTTPIALAEHLQDLRLVLDEIISSSSSAASAEAKEMVKPTIIAHSLGGIITMKLLEDPDIRTNKLSGVVLACSVPPSGNGPMTMRFLRRDPIASIDIIRGFVLKAAGKNMKLCRKLFYDEQLDENRLVGYMSCMQRDGKVSIDLNDLLQQLPSKRSMDPETGIASWMSADKASQQLKRLVLGASDDYIVDEAGVQEAARYLSTTPIMLKTSHDFMLGARWRLGADSILSWLSSPPPQQQ
jgi:pimeloyl-ACP methyl ester carboxylesterase